MKKIMVVIALLALCGTCWAEEVEINGPMQMLFLADTGLALVSPDEDEAGNEAGVVDGIYVVKPLQKFDLKLVGKGILAGSLREGVAYDYRRKDELGFHTGETVVCDPVSTPLLFVVFEEMTISNTMTKEDILATLPEFIFADGEAATILQTGRGFSYEKGTINVVELLSDNVVLGDILPDATIGAMKMVKIWWTERPEHTDPNKPEEEPTPPSEYREVHEGWGGGGGGCDAGLGAEALTLFALAVVMMKRKLR